MVASAVSSNAAQLICLQRLRQDCIHKQIATEQSGLVPQQDLKDSAAIQTWCRLDVIGSRSQSIITSGHCSAIHV